MVVSTLAGGSTVDPFRQYSLYHLRPGLENQKLRYWNHGGPRQNQAKKLVYGSCTLAQLRYDTGTSALFKSYAATYHGEKLPQPVSQLKGQTFVNALDIVASLSCSLIVRLGSKPSYGSHQSECHAKIHSGDNASLSSIALAMTLPVVEQDWMQAYRRVAPEVELTHY
jgi:hypothetical protein